MNLEELLLQLRRDYLDDAAGFTLYSDEALIGFIADAQRQVCLRARALVDSTTPAVTAYALAAGDRSVQLHPSILAVRMVRVAPCKHPLVGTTAKRLWKRDPGWDIADPADPRHWIPDYQDGYLYLDRPVEQDTTLHLSVWRMPLEEEALEGNDDEPVIALHWHQDLLDWAAHRAFSGKDTQTADDARADRALRAFEAKVGRLPSMTEVRLWGISPIVGVPAEFE